MILQKIFFLTLVLLLTGCGEQIVILKNKDFSNGDWLLVNSDGNKKTQFIIDDEKILQENPNSIKISFSEEDQYTTCDGQLQLFKDGKLVAEQVYLDPSCLTESNAIKKAYKKCSGGEVYPENANDFKRQWDSLKKIPNCYPTLYHTQPDDKDIIWFYTYE